MARLAERGQGIEIGSYHANTEVTIENCKLGNVAGQTVGGGQFTCHTLAAAGSTSSCSIVKVSINAVADVIPQDSIVG